MDENEDQHNRFFYYDARTNTKFTDKAEINTLDLLKKGKNKMINFELAQWIDFFNARTKEEMKMLQTISLPEIKQAAEIVEYVNQDKGLRIQAEQRENALRAFRSEIAGSKEEGLKEGIEKGLKQGIEKGKEEGLKEGKEEGLKEGKEEGLKEGKEEGLKEGKEKGLKEGIEKGLKESKIETAKNCLTRGFDIETISAITGLTSQEIEKLKITIYADTMYYTKKL